MFSATCCSAGSAGRLPAVRVDPARNQAPRVAVCQPPGLWKKFCTQSPTLDEEPLQQAILAAVNAVMLDRDTLARQLAAVMEWELAPVLGESMSLADI